LHGWCFNRWNQSRTAISEPWLRGNGTPDIAAAAQGFTKAKFANRESKHPTDKVKKERISGYCAFSNRQPDGLRRRPKCGIEME
jgi:hypothetical protein